MYKEILKLRMFRQNTPSLIRDEFRKKGYTIYGCDEKGRDRPYHVKMYDKSFGNGGKCLFHYLLIPRTYYYV